MKTKILISIICACSLFSIQAQERWGYVNTLADEWLRKIWTQGLDTVYIVGENGLIARSTDQGETWEKQYFPTQVALNDIIFIDHHTGFIVGEQGTVLKTTDAGEIWKEITLDATSHINAIAATGLNNIWAVGDNSLILHSTDAGETWEQQNVLPKNDRQLLDIAFRENLGYFTGNYATVYKTEDFGVTWNEQTITEQSGSFVNTKTHSINIMENKTYLMVGDYLYSTEDQVNWVSAFDDNTPGMVSYSNPFFLNDNVGYASVVLSPTCCGSDILYILKTINDGTYWEIIEEQHSSYYPMQNVDIIPSMIKIVNDTLGYAIFSQVLLKTPAPISIINGIEEIKNDNKLNLIQITKDELLLQSELFSILSVEFFNISGNSLIKKQIPDPAENIEIDIRNLPNGVYLIKVMCDNNTVSINKYIRK